MGTITLKSNKSAWKGELEWSYANGLVSCYLYTWKSDGYPSSASSGAPFTAVITVGGSTSQTFSFQQQEVNRMLVGSFSAKVSGSSVSIGAVVTAPYGVSMYNNPLSGSQVVTLEAEPEKPDTEPSSISLSSPEAVMGQSILITLNRNSAFCTHTLSYKTPDGRITVMAEHVLSTYSWVVPDLSASCTENLRVTVLCDTYEDSQLLGRTAADLILLLPEATQPQCQQEAVMGSSLAITLNRRAENFTHTVTARFADQQVEIARDAAASCLWQIPLDLAKAIPTLTRATATLTCITYNAGYQVGSRTVTVVLTVPDNDLTKPRGTMTLSPTGDLGEDFAGMFIRGRTGVRAEFQAESDYARVESYRLSVDGREVTGNPAQSQSLASHGQVTVTGWITDSRGYVRQLSQVLTVIAYDLPRVVPYTGASAVTAHRCTREGSISPTGGHLLIRAGRTYTQLTKDGRSLNKCTLSYRLKAAGAAQWGSFITLIPGSDPETREIQFLAENAVPDVKTAYTVQLRAEDTLGGYSVITVSVGAMSVPLHLAKGGNGAAVGQYYDPSRPNGFQIGYTTWFDRGIGLNPIFSGGSWPVGQTLGSAVSDSNSEAAASYTLFLAVCQEQPVLLARYGQSISGSQIRMELSDGLKLLQAPAAVTAMYALL